MEIFSYLKNLSENSEIKKRGRLKNEISETKYHKPNMSSLRTEAFLRARK